MLRQVLLVCLALLAVVPARAQRRHKHAPVVVVPDSAAPVEIKEDRLVLRYKPQAGTLLYNVRTVVKQHVQTDQTVLDGSLTSAAQLAFHNISVDYKKGLWTFERFFTQFDVYGRELSGDTLQLKEHQAVNRITRLTYEMTGHELTKEVIDSMKLFNAEAQTNAYFFQPPRMLIPLPENAITYGDTWGEHTIDTIQVHDTVNIGVTDGRFIYDVAREYHLQALVDTFGGHLAMIVAHDTGSFQGEQSNSLTKVVLKTQGPIHGADTTYLDLASGRVLMRSIGIDIPALIDISSGSGFTDILEVRSVVMLDQSNARDLRKE